MESLSASWLRVVRLPPVVHVQSSSMGKDCVFAEVMAVFPY